MIVSMKMKRRRIMFVKETVCKKILVTGLIAGLGVVSFVNADDDRPPTADRVAFAQRASELMFRTLFAALTQEFDETTAGNVPEGSQSIGLIFNDSNEAMRLVGTLDPLSGNDRPRDSFEREALAFALNGGQPHTAVQRVDDRWFYRRSIPLSSFRKECTLCHTNFGPVDATKWVGALMLRVPIKN
jgi:hypothetical protein